jgi:hypothetical protein
MTLFGPGVADIATVNATADSSHAADTASPEDPKLTEKDPDLCERPPRYV